MTCEKFLIGLILGQRISMGQHFIHENISMSFPIAITPCRK